VKNLLASSLRLEKKLDNIAALLAFLASETQDGLPDKARVLSRLGLRPARIAEICGTTAMTVSVRLSEAKKRARGARKKGK
jgi:DNA-directed RNA polymerase specialized sigma24 family protein